MKKIFVLIIVFFCLPVYAKVKVHFTPSLECENSIVGLINNSKKTIDIAVYSINNNQIVEALKKHKVKKINIKSKTNALKIIMIYGFTLNMM